MAVKISCNEAQIEKLDIEACLSYTLQCISNLPRVWVDAPAEHKQKFQKLVFPAGIPYARISGFGTVDLGVIYELSQ